MTYAEQAMKRLEGYEGQEEWNDCIDGKGYDQDATQAADPGCRNDTALYTDGSSLIWQQGDGWRVFAPEFGAVVSDLDGQHGMKWNGQNWQKATV